MLRAACRFHVVSKRHRRRAEAADPCRLGLLLLRGELKRLPPSFRRGT
jgi:hypothetical protein